MRPPLLYSELTLAFPPAFTITSPSPDRGEVMVKAGGRTLLSSRSRPLPPNSHPQILRKSLFFIRATNEYLQLGLHWLEADKQCVFQNEVLDLDRKTFVQKYLNKTAMLHELSRFNETLESFKTTSDQGEARHQINGHDFVRLLAKRLHPIVRNKNFADADVIERVLPGFADYGQLSEAQMFATLISRVSS
jgi:hypothetical protein